EAASRLARALVRAGVTTTITRADARRYGDLKYDSNVPDFRMAFGASPTLLVSLGIRAPVARTTTYIEARAQGDSDGESTQPALPILVVPTIGALDSIVAGVERSCTIRVPMGSAHVDSMRALEKRGVALFTRDAPSVHTSPEGVVALNLLRSC